MNKILKRITIPLIAGLLFVSVPGSIFAQTASVMPDEKLMEGYREQVKRLVGFLQFSLNTLGDDETSTREKEVIINESFLKAFMDDKVQVEDDLDENRETISYKDIQAYLKDVDFFFQKAEFNFDVKDIQAMTNDRGMLYFKVTANRALKGLTVENEKVDNNKVRYIEINIDEDEQVLKIVSIYTTKLNEREEQLAWWNGLPAAWKEELGRSYAVSEDATFDQVTFISDSLFRVNRNLIQDIRKVDTIIKLGIDTVHIAGWDTIYSADYETLTTRNTGVLRILSDIIRSENLDISGNIYIRDLSALEQMTSLTRLDISNTTIGDLFPVRNLTNLVYLNFSGTAVSDLDPIKYNTKIRELYFDNTRVSRLDAINNFQLLETVHFNGTQVWDLHPVQALPSLKDVRFDQTPVTDLSPLSNQQSLEHLSFSGTQVSDLSPLRNLLSLKRLYFESTPVANLDALAGLTNLQLIDADQSGILSLEPLTDLASLETVYADKTGITSAMANQFMAKHPGCLVIYESEELSGWWQATDPTWQKVFRELVPLDDNPGTEQLHAITLIDILDVHGKKEITSLAPLSKMVNLRELNCYGTGIMDLEPLHGLVDLNVLDIHETSISSLLPLADLVHLQVLNAAKTDITSLEGLESLSGLQQLNIEDTQVKDLGPLQGNTSLQLIYCDRTSIGKYSIDKYLHGNPGCLVIYQTSVLRSWWNNLPESWDALLRTYVSLDDAPTKEQLHQVSMLKELDLSNRNDLYSLDHLSVMTSLEKLNIANTQATGLHALAGLINLKELNVSNNPLTDLGPISGMTGLESLDISNTPVTRLDQVASLKNLQYLNCSGTDVKKLDPLMELFELTRLDIYNTGISSLKAIEYLPSLRQLRCYNTRISFKKIDEYQLAHPRVEVTYY